MKGVSDPMYIRERAAVLVKNFGFTTLILL
ncbi:MAG: hypothetical protein QG556_1036, partial [Pseudomonadota bacterium]|nr:hypothetical protein [Pseudomonadota bacterium]